MHSFIRSSIQLNRSPEPFHFNNWYILSNLINRNKNGLKTKCSPWFDHFKLSKVIMHIINPQSLLSLADYELPSINITTSFLGYYFPFEGGMPLHSYKMQWNYQAPRRISSAGVERERERERAVAGDHPHLAQQCYTPNWLTDWLNNIYLTNHYLSSLWLNPTLPGQYSGEW